MKKVLVFAVGIIVVTISFQNCTGVNFGSQPTSQQAASTPGNPSVDPTFPNCSNPAGCDFTYWITGTWGNCPVSCGGGTQTRTVTCQNVESVQMPNASCTLAQPSTTQACNTQVCATTPPPSNTSGGWVAYNWQPQTAADVSSIQPCSAEGFYRTDIATGFHTPTSCGDIGVVCDLFETMGVTINNGWPQYMLCKPTLGQIGTWAQHQWSPSDDTANINSCENVGFNRTGLLTYTVPTSCGDVDSICDLFALMGTNINGAWPHYYKCGPNVSPQVGTWQTHTYVTSDSYKQIRSCSDAGFFRTGLGASYHTPTSCGDVGSVCDLFNVMGVTLLTGAAGWPHYLECH